MLLIDAQTPWTNVLEAIGAFSSETEKRRGYTKEEIDDYEQSMTLPDSYREFLRIAGASVLLPLSSRYDELDFRLSSVKAFAKQHDDKLLIGLGPITLGCGGEENQVEAYLNEREQVVDQYGEPLSNSFPSWFFWKAWCHWHLPGFAREISLMWNRLPVDLDPELHRLGYTDLGTRTATKRFFSYHHKADLMIREAGFGYYCGATLRTRTPAAAHGLIRELAKALPGTLSIWRDASGPLS